MTGVGEREFVYKEKTKANNITEIASLSFDKLWHIEDNNEKNSKSSILGWVEEE